MRIKRMLTAQLEAIESRLSGGDKRYVTGALAMVDLLQEPQTLRKAPEDMPAIGQALFARGSNRSLLCVRSGEKWLTIIDANGHLFTADLAMLEEWVPVEPPQFPEDRS